VQEQNGQLKMSTLKILNNFELISSLREATSTNFISLSSYHFNTIVFNGKNEARPQWAEQF
jgi:hypothetical protein